MVVFSGQLKKLCSTVAESGEVSYFFADDRAVSLNSFIGKELTLTFLDQITCLGCGKRLSKTYFNGYCYPCLIKLPENADCVTQPEKCRAHLHEGRDIQWELDHHNQAHVVYLSNTSGVKVGVTSVAHLPMRWIDQGATEALVIARTPNRYEAGVIEVALKQHISDKTVWHRMLTTHHADFDLKQFALDLSVHFPEASLPYRVSDEPLHRLHYPVSVYPGKVKSLNIESIKIFTDFCVGIKGQYILFQSGSVFHVRKHGGYFVNMAISDALQSQ